MQTPFCGGSFEALLPQLLGNVRYPTHAVGKWVRTSPHAALALPLRTLLPFFSQCAAPRLLPHRDDASVPRIQ